MSDTIRAMHNFRRAAYALEQVARAALAPLSLDPTAYALLDYVAGNNRATPKGFRDFSGGSNQSYHISQSVEAGLITNTQDEGDKRARILALTPHGRDVHLEATARLKLFLSSKGLDGEIKEFTTDGNANRIINSSEITILGAEKILNHFTPPEQKY